MNVFHSLLNVFAVKYYGGKQPRPQRDHQNFVPENVSFLESEFWLALGKAILAVGVIAFTFVTMVGGNPLHYAYGFRNWDREESVLDYFNVPSNLHLNLKPPRYLGLHLPNT